MKHHQITISGTVQGVFFRKFTVAQMTRLGLTGFVRNEPNGDVYCEAEGSEDQLAEFETWCWTGSPLSTVTAVKVTDGPMVYFQTVEIRR